MSLNQYTLDLPEPPSAPIAAGVRVGGNSRSTASLPPLLVPVHGNLLCPYLLRIKPPRLPLVVFIPIQAPSRNPLALDERPLIHGRNPRMRSAARCERNPEPLADP